MIRSFGLNEVYTLLPLLTLLTGAVAELIIETFFPKRALKFSFSIALFTLFLTGGAFYFQPSSTNPFLSDWLSFDSLERFFSYFFLLIGFFSLLLSPSFLSKFGVTQGEFYFFLLSSLFGLFLIGSAADFLTLFLGIETLSIALYILCGYKKSWEVSSESSMKYFFIGAIGAAFLLYGIALIYGSLGTTRFDQLMNGYQSLSSDSSKFLFMGGVAFITAGLAFKAAIAPFHFWTPDVYSASPTPVTAFMAVGTKAGAFIALAKLFLVILPNFNLVWNEGVALLAYPTLIYANFLALKQTQFRRFFAYSGISHAGFLLFPLIASTPDALTALLFYLVIYSLATFGAFSVLSLLDQKKEGVMFQDVEGLFKEHPLLAGCFTLFLLTLSGLPPLVGFLGKFYLFKTIFEAKYYVLVILGLLTAILSATYYLKIVSLMISNVHKKTEIYFSWPIVTVLTLCLGSICYLSIFPEFLQKLISVYVN